MHPELVRPSAQCDGNVTDKLHRVQGWLLTVFEISDEYPAAIRALAPFAEANFITTMSNFSSKIVLLATMGGLALSQSSEATMRDVISEWAATVRANQTEKVKFEQDKSVLDASKESLEAEIADLNAQIEKLEASKGASDLAKQKVLAEKETLEAARKAFGEQLDALEEKAVKILPILPQSLIRNNVKLAGAVEAFEAHQKAAEMSKLGLTKRLQNVLTIISEAETFNQRVSHVDEVRKIQGEDHNLSMVYFGLAVAYGANADASIGVVASPSADGWQYAEKPELAKDILSLVKVAKGDEQASFVNLPVTIK